MKLPRLQVNSIKHRMIILFLALSLLSIGLITLFSHYYYSKAVKEDFKLITTEATNRLNHHMEFYFKQMKNSTNTLINTALTQQWLRQEYVPGPEDINEIEMEMKTYVSFNFPEIVNMYLVSNDKRVLPLFNNKSRNQTYANESWYSAVPLTAVTVLPTQRLDGTGPLVLSMVIPIYSTINLEIIGNLVVQFSLSEIEATFAKSKLGKTGFFFILSGDNTFVYHPNKEWIGKRITDTPLKELDWEGAAEKNMYDVNGTAYLVSYGVSSDTGWKIVSIVPYAEMAHSLQSAVQSTLITFVVISLLIMIVIPLLLRQFIHPIKQLKSLMEAVAMGNLSVRAHKVSTINEFQILNYSFNKMVKQLIILMDEVSYYKVKEVELQLKQSEATIRALQNQINPHLLYNTLDIIKSIAFLEDVPLIEKITQNLADVYRYASKWSYDEVTLEEELSSLTKYLDIIHIRYPKKFESGVRVNEKLLSCPIIKLSIQPVVENAVKYAVEPKGGEAAIIVTAYKERQDLIIEIADNGPGISDEKLASLEEQFASQSSNEETLMSGTIGLANVHARLSLKYGQGYGVFVHSFPGRGSVISIRIPYRGP
ncbi:putative sensor-like histidine kinase [Paenibacillus konkukensis]|uniref:histidine kinase n=1 Tax=Paenibacillus konkukensis TaxID=2020716 RepID=A0ABY4RHM9_9BACL|nr:cache domain-containing protein [Paenibacillus konkukensis]UQZ80932.1 putative sensor-like histidine kinase [Paenibacillus konkukensis]